MSRITTYGYSTPWLSDDYNKDGVKTSHTSGSSVALDKVITRGDIVKTPWPRPKVLRPLPYSASLHETMGIAGREIIATSLPSVDGKRSYRVREGNLNTLITPMTGIAAPAVTAGLRQQAEVDALLKVKNQKVNYAQAFVEAGQTIRLVESTAIKIAKAARAVKSGNLVKAARELGVSFSRGKRKHREPGDNWLELQYGWKPLLSDVYGAAEDLAQRNTENPDRFICRAVGTKRTRTSGFRIRGSGLSAYSVTDRSEASVRVVLTYRLANPTLASANAQGLLNPAVLIWEELPFSFVADWFIPIGGYLNTLGATTGWDFLMGYRSELCFSYSDRPTFVGDHRDFIGGSFSNGYARHKTFERSVYAASPVPEAPGFKNPLSTTHMMNAIALLRGVFF